VDNNTIIQSLLLKQHFFCGNRVLLLATSAKPTKLHTLAKEMHAAAAPIQTQEMHAQVLKAVKAAGVAPSCPWDIRAFFELYTGPFVKNIELGV
jgi:DNA polymerase III delta subunit